MIVCAKAARGVRIVGERVVRKLTREEHIRTKALYELVFPEDQGAFVDYYYEEIATENEILVVEQDGQILAMLHLNTYDLLIGGVPKKIPYIVAVATHPDYRHQGFMKSLLFLLMSRSTA